MYNGKKCAPRDTKTQKTTWEKLGTYPPTDAVTQNFWELKVKGKDRYHIKNKTGQRARAEMNIHVL